MAVDARCVAQLGYRMLQKDEEMNYVGWNATLLKTSVGEDRVGRIGGEAR